MSAAKPGDWVLVWGQVIDKPTHPDDVVVEFFSHNEQWAGHIRRDRVEEADTPDFAAQCYSLFRTQCYYARCTKTFQHAGNHESDDGLHQWMDHQSSGGIDR